MRPDGSYVGRAAPEIDVFEALVENGVGMVSFFVYALFEPLMRHQNRFLFLLNGRHIMSVEKYLHEKEWSEFTRL